jgi:hypothetical protein
MTIAAAELFWAGLGIYLAAGLLVAIIYGFFAARAVDHGAEGAGLGFRLIIMPGVALLWPIMVLRLISGQRINAPVQRHEGDEA